MHDANMLCMRIPSDTFMHLRVRGAYVFQWKEKEEKEVL